MEKQLDQIMRQGLQEEIVRWKGDNEQWVTTLDYFLEKEFVQRNINEYIDRQKRSWIKWFQEQLGDNIQRQMVATYFQHLMRSDFVYRDYVSHSYVKGIEIFLDTHYRVFLKNVTEKVMIQNMKDNGKQALQNIVD